LVHDPDTFQPYMLFTAWQDIDGRKREVWIAKIDKGLNVRDKQQIATADLFTDVTGLNTATAFWDDYNEQWVFACTAYGAPKKSYGYFIFFDKGWNVEDTQVIDFESTFNSTTFTPNLGDAGIGMVPTDKKVLALSSGADVDRRLYRIDDLTSRPLPDPTYGSTSDGVDFPPVSQYAVGSIDVHQLFAYEGMVVMLSERMDRTGHWTSIVHFGPDIAWNEFPSVNMIGKFLMPTPIVWGHGALNYTSMIPNQLQHPHYTTELETPLLFFVTSPSYGLSGERRYRHEIWAQTIDPTRAFDPAKNFPLVAMERGSSIIYDASNPVPIPTFGASTVTVELYGAGSSGTLTVKGSYSPNFVWGDSRVYSNNYSIDSGSSRHIFNKLAPYIAVQTDVDVDAWSVTLRGG